MRRLLLAGVLELLTLTCLLGAGAAPSFAESSNCQPGQPGQTVHVRAYYTPMVLQPGETATNVIELTNCTDTTQQVTYSGQVTAPRRCGSMTVPFGPIPVTLAPGETAREEVTFSAPPCVGNYRQVVYVYQNGTLVDQATATFTVIPAL